jgi:hypothetical protein
MIRRPIQVICAKLAIGCAAFLMVKGLVRVCDLRPETFRVQRMRVVNIVFLLHFIINEIL